MVIPSKALNQFGSLLDVLLSNKFSLCRLRLLKPLQPIFNQTLDGTCVAVEVLKENASQAIQALAGELPGCLFAKNEEEARVVKTLT